MNLNYIRHGQGPPLIILHGLFGMLDNWKSVAKQLEGKFTVYLIDQRNHGKSPHLAEHSYKLMAQDLFEFMKQQGIDSANIIGHSMGGKTAMQFALDHPQLVKQLIIVDMGVKRYPAGHDNIFDTLLSINLIEIHSRGDAEKILHDRIGEFGVRQFLMKNLSRHADGTYAWKFNLEGLYKNYESGILAPVSGDHPFAGKTLFIRGGRSSYILNEDWDEIQHLFPNSTLYTIQNAGHWVHADEPNELLRAVGSFLEI